ncbi:MAG: hypothetical protein SFV81_16125, partial [Pirellulaceae bacterium]|nr:hypothetical protein [Pirellulaceae bacterium]
WGPGLNLRDGILTVPSHSWIAKVDIWINQNIGNGWGGDPVNELVVTYTDRNGNVGSTRFDLALVKHIVFMGSDGAEVVKNETSIPCILYGGGGMDSLSGGSANDLIFGGEGGDTLYGNLGSDKIFGGNGDDYLSGGSDTVRDELYGEIGADDFAPGVEDWTDFNKNHGDTNRRGR